MTSASSERSLGASRTPRASRASGDEPQTRPAPRGKPRKPGRRDDRGCFGALDLGTNNCRLLIAEPTRHGFRVVEAFSQIVRLGEGLKATGELQPGAVDRTLGALRQAAEKIARRPGIRYRCVTTQACREARNGADFIRRVRAETGIELEVISPREEARLAVLGCADLFDQRYRRCLVVDIGGGSTEVSQVEIPAGDPDARQRQTPRIIRWSSSPIGVVNLAERHPEKADRAVWYREMLEDARAVLDWPPRGLDADAEREARINCYVIGTSGTVTSLAGVHLDLPRYDRRHVDGMWLHRPDMQAAVQTLLGVDRDARAQNPCVGHDRADLVLAGCAIFDAVLEQAPAEHIRVADRGLREGILMSLIHGPRRRRRGRRRGPRGGAGQQGGTGAT